MSSGIEQVEDTERTRLLADSTAGHGIRPRSTPVPWKSILPLYLLASTQPIVFELIFPFINQMILDIGVVDNPKDVGFYSGIIESIFACMSFLAIMPCAFISNRYGRKIVILTSAAGLAISTALFGMSHSFALMVITRCVGGMLGGGSMASKTMIAELTDRSNQAIAFSYLGIAYRTGQIIGQPLGGILSHPARKWEFFDSPFWIKNPFALPCIVAASFASVSVLTGYIFLEETLPSKRSKAIVDTDHESSSSTTLDGVHSSKPSYSSLPIRSALTPQVLSIVLTTFGMVFETTALIAIYPLFAFTPVKTGGLGLNETSIGFHLALRSLFCVFAMANLANLQRRFGMVRLYRRVMFLWPVTVLFFPLLNLLARNEMVDTLLFDGLLVLFFAFWATASLSWLSVTIMGASAAPSPEAVATVAGLTQMALVLPQAIAPAFGTALFAISKNCGLFEGNLVWIVLTSLGFFTALHTMTLTEPQQDWREEYQNRLKSSPGR